MTAPQVSTVGRPLPQQVVRIFGDLHFRTDGGILGLACAPDGTAWTIEVPGTVRHWQVESGSQLSVLPLSDVEVIWAISPDGKLLAAGSDDLAVWNAATGKLLYSRRQPAWISALAFDAAGQMLASGHDGGHLCLWPLGAKRPKLHWCGHEEPISALAFRPDGKVLASAAEERTIHLWDTATGKQVGKLDGHTDHIQALAWHPDGRILVSAGWDTMARVWDAAKCEPIIFLNGHAEVVSAAAFAPDGKCLATADSSNTIWIWDHAAGKPIHQLRGHAGEITALVFRNNDHLLSGGQDSRLMLWDVKQGRSLSGTADPHSETARLALRPDGKLLAYVNGSPMLRVWDTATGGSVLQSNHAAALTAVAYRPDGSTLAVGDDRGGIHLWSGDGTKLLKSFPAHKTAITSLAFSSDGKLLASAGATDGYVYLWSLTDEEPKLLIPEATDNGTVESLAWAPGSPVLLAGGVDWLATGKSDGETCAWDVQKPACVATFLGGTTRVAVRADGKQFASTNLEDSVCLWDLPGQRLARELRGHQSMVTGLAYSPNGKLLATGSDDGTLRLWNTESGAQVDAIELATPISDLCFAPDGKHVYTANASVTCYVVRVGT